MSKDENTSSTGEAADEAVAETGFGFVEAGPPPDIRQRELIFDSMQKIFNVQPGKGGRRVGGTNRGTFVYTWGAGYHGQLGRKFQRGKKKYSAVPEMVILPDLVVKQVACGACNTAIVTETGQVWTWGEGLEGNMGSHGDHSDPSKKQTPRIVEKLEMAFIVQVACGGAHTVAVTDNGMIYSWGYNKYGQLGINSRTNAKEPRKLMPGPQAGNERSFRQVSCGHNHTLAINRAGQAIAWGCGKQGQIGMGSDDDDEKNKKIDKDELEPTIIPSLKDKKMISVSAGAIHSCFVTEEGEVYLMGFGEHFNQDGTEHFFYTPKLCPMPEPMKQISCGQNHNIALSQSGNVYCWGSGEYGQTGYGIYGNVSVPRLVMDTGNVAQVAAGRYHSCALTNTGVMYSWGCGENGQLGLNSDENVALPTVVTANLGTVTGQISCGEHHTAVLTAAPWSKLSNDMNEWLTSYRVEQELKVKQLKVLNRGLTRQDLVKIKEDMKKWHQLNDQRKMDLAEEDSRNRQKDIESVEKPSVLLKEVVSKRLTTADALSTSSTLSLPSVEGAKALEPPAAAEEDAEDAKAPLRLPAVAAARSRKASPGRATEKSATASLPVVRRQAASARSGSRESPNGGSGQSQALVPMGSSQSAFSRTSFLKETAQMVKRMTTIVSDKGEAQTQKELAMMIRLVQDYRKEYDALRHYCRSRAESLAELRKDAEVMETAEKLSKVAQDDLMERLNALKMQLNTVTIKIAETGENRRNYELNIAHLKEEDFEHFNQLKLLRRQMQDNNNFFKKINELRAQSLEEKDKSEVELSEFNNEIRNYQNFVKNQLSQFDTVLAIVREQNEKRDHARSVRSEQTRGKVQKRIDKLSAEVEATDREVGGLTSRLTSLDLKLRHFEDAFQKIVAATGLTDPAAIVDKHFFKRTISDQLHSELFDKGEDLKKLKETNRMLQEVLREKKAGVVDEKWSHVSALHEGKRETESKTQKVQTDAEKMQERVAFVQEGLLHLLRNVEQSVGKNLDYADLEGAQLWGEPQTSEAVTRINSALDSLVTKQQEQQSKKDKALADKGEEEAKTATA